MTCLKCGRETEESFCEVCREEMKSSPVKPGTVVQIPNRNQYLSQKVRKHTFTDPEKENQILRKKIRKLYICIAVLIVLILALCAAAFGLYTRSRTRLPGQNYSTVTHPTEETAPMEGPAE